MHATESFLRLIWPSTGLKTLVTIKDRVPKHYWFEETEISEAATKANELSREGYEVYMAVSSFNSKNSREATNVKSVKTLFLDIDCGKNKDYETPELARDALSNFIAKSQLPSPLVVSSGFGLHIYWPLNNEVTHDEWLVLATALKQLTEHLKLSTDKKCTADAARILRPIGTFNYKNGKPRRVQALAAGQLIIVKDIKEILLKQTTGVFDILLKQQVKNAKPKTTDFGDTPLVVLNDILPQCRTLKYVIENQNEITEPLWYGALGLATYCQEPEQTAIRLSNQHPSYDKTDTLKKATQWKAHVSGPPTCAYFRACAGSQCEGCPQQVTSPILLGRPVNTRVATTVTVEPPPTSHFLDRPATRFTDKFLRMDGYGFQVGMQGKPDGNGNTPPPSWIKIANYGLQPLLNLKLLDKNGNEANYVWMEAHDANWNTLTTFVVPSTAVNKSDQFATECARHGICNEQEVSPTAFKMFTTIMRNWVQKLSEKQTKVITFDSFGWMGAEGTFLKDSFLLGDKLYTASGTKTIPILPHLKEYQEAMVPQGSLEEWTKAMDNYNMPGMEAYMFNSWAAWGAPLMVFTSNKNVVVSLVGDTGVGKSSLQRAIASVYGDYNSNVLVDQHDSTINSVNANLGCLNSLPYIREEGTEKKDYDEIVSWVLTMTQGRDRGRLNPALQKVPVKTWNTIAIISSNTSVREIIINTRRDSVARLARTWEVYMESPLKSDDAMRLFNPLRTNFGWAGPIFIDYVVRNREEVIKLVGNTEAILMKRFNAVGSDRFHISFIAACLVGAQIAINLGLIHHDFIRGRNYAYKQYRKLHQAAIDEQMTPEQILALMIQEMRANTIVVEMDAPTAAAPTTIFSSDNNIIHSPPGQNCIEARYAADSSVFYIGSSIIRKWYVDNHLNYRMLMDVLKNKNILVEENKKIVLTKGTKLADKRQVRCSMFDLSQSDELVEAVKG